MPVDPTLVNYKMTDGGKERIVIPNGYVISGETGMMADKADGAGYISHFATCQKARMIGHR